MEQELTGTIFVTGFAGNAMWDIAGNPAQARVYHLPKLRGGNMTEFRLRVGFINAPLPIFMIARVAEMQAISASPEMAPWPVGGSYDRPVAGRLVESEGVPREIYAQEKKAVSQPLWFAPATEEQLTPASLADLRRYIRTTAQRRPSRDAPRSLQARLTGCTPPPAGALAEMSTETCAQERHTGVRRARPLFTQATPAGFQNNGLKFHWAVAHTVERYRSTEMAVGADRGAA